MPLIRLIAILVVALLSPLVIAAQDTNDPEEEKKKTTFTFGGYAKLDWLTTQYFDGEPDPESPIRDIHIPSAIPVGSELDGYDTELHARESRFFFDVNSTL